MNDIRILLTPAWDGEKIPSLKVCLGMDAAFPAGTALLNINRVTIFKPFTELAAPIAISDALGPVAHAIEDLQLPPVQHQLYRLQRETSGEVQVSYELKLQQAGRNPVFDLGWETGGMNGSGMTFMPSLPEGRYRYTLEWDLSALPEGCTGAWSFGEGRITREGNENLLKETFYAAGQLDKVKLGSFGYYWFKNDSILDYAVDTAKIFRYESEFFEDAGQPYNIFGRFGPDEVKRCGGTALQRSYMFVYGRQEHLDASWLKFLFAHEMVHNWVDLENETFGTGTWYIEGMAEFYSAVLPWRMGIVSKAELAFQLNRRAKDYYENPCIHATNLEAGAQLMADPDMTLLPYGRGFFYLLHADEAIRRATQGEKCLDDVMRALLHLQKTRVPTNDDWLQAYGGIVGEDVARREYGEMSMGKAIYAPCLACFGGAVAAEQCEGVQRTTNKPCACWRFV